jgi:hypothetical protein
VNREEKVNEVAPVEGVVVGSRQARAESRASLFPGSSRFPYLDRTGSAEPAGLKGPLAVVYVTFWLARKKLSGS